MKWRPLSFGSVSLSMRKKPCRLPEGLQYSIKTQPFSSLAYSIPSDLLSTDSPDTHNQICTPILVTIHHCSTSKNTHSDTLNSHHNGFSFHLACSTSPPKQRFSLIRPPACGCTRHGSSNTGVISFLHSPVIQIPFTINT